VGVACVNGRCRIGGGDRAVAAGFLKMLGHLREELWGKKKLTRAGFFFYFFIFFNIIIYYILYFYAT
jgi:hypothetical protein